MIRINKQFIMARYGGLGDLICRSVTPLPFAFARQIHNEDHGELGDSQRDGGEPEGKLLRASWPLRAFRRILCWSRRGQDTLLTACSLKASTKEAVSLYLCCEQRHRLGGKISSQFVDALLAGARLSLVK